MKNDYLFKGLLAIVTVITLLGFGAITIRFLLLDEELDSIHMMQQDLSDRLDRSEKYVASMDSRPIMPDEYFGDEIPNLDISTEAVEYRRDDFGISVQLPSNPAWGSEKYRIKPYTEYGMGSSHLSFGRAHPFEGGGWIRQYYMNVLPASSTQEVLAKIENEQSQDLAFGPREVTQINGVDVVMYHELGLCDSLMFEVVGRKANYHFESLCGGDEARSELLDVIKTIEFIE